MTTLAKKKLNPQEDARFEEFLKKQFAGLKRELEKYPQGGLQKKQGKVLQLSQAPQSRAGKHSWRYGIAAAVLVAVAVPMVIQLNQQKAELSTQVQAPSLEQDKQRPGRGDKPKGMAARKTASRAADIDSVSDLVAGERAEGNLKKSREEETASRDRFAAAEMPAEQKNAGKDMLAMKEEAKPTLRAATPKYEAGGGVEESRQSAATAAPSPAAPAPSAAPASPSASASMASRDEAPAKPAARSITLGDAQEKRRKQDAGEEEKAEMEKLWKEFEKDPKSFSKDTKRSARLKVLLARHDTKSKARAKRVKTAERQLAQ